MSKKAAKVKTMVDIEAGECRWPIGDPRHADFHFCGAQQVLGRPYCAHHWSLSFDSTKSRPHGRAAVALLPIRQAA